VGPLGGSSREHREIGDNLVVARACRVQAAPRRTCHLADAPLDRHVDVFVGRLEREAALEQLGLDGVERRIDRVTVGVGDDPLRCQHLGVRPRLGHVLRPQPPVDGQRDVHLREERILRFGEARHRGAV
jgi:hypothetical protein